MDIEGLGVSVAQSLLENGLIKSPGDIYYLNPNDVASLERMGKKSADNLIAAAERSKGNDLSRLIYAFGILQVVRRRQRASPSVSELWKRWRTPRQRNSVRWRI